MIQRLLMLLYTLFYSVALLFFLPYEYFKRPRDLRKRWLKERLGKYSTEDRMNRSAEVIKKGLSNFLTSEPKTVWIHAVSVGEVIASVPFIQEMMKTIPSVNVILTTVTDTGQKVAKERLSGSARIFYIPFDLPFCVRKFIKEMRPSLYISIETEIWPNLFLLLKKVGIPVLIMNGRISDNSFKGYRWIRFFMKRIFNAVDLFCMQEDLYAERIKNLGAPAERIRITGNFKFDIKIDEYRHNWVRHIRRPIVLAGSTHEGEEEMVLAACERLMKEIGDMTLIIAPRHPERFDEVEETIKKKGLRYKKRSRIDDCVDIATLRDTEVVLVDLIGELASLYSVCDIAIIGGSFSGRGGHNPLEPAFWGKPILCGDDMSNFPFIDEFYKEEAAIRTSKDKLYDDLKQLLLSENERINMGKRATELFKGKAGAIMRSIGILERYVKLS